MNLFSAIGSKTSLEEALALLAAVEDAAAAQKPDTGIEDDGSDLVALRVKLTEVQRDYELLNSLLEKVYEENGRQNLPRLKQIATIAAKDYRSAYDLTTFYTKEWFSRLFMNIDDKIDFAAHLFALVEPFAVKNTGCWEMLVANEPMMLNYVSVPHPDSISGSDSGGDDSPV